jgi:hypothetical protein
MEKQRETVLRYLQAQFVDINAKMMEEKELYPYNEW